ncbi:MAG: AAA family ATPase, partial [Chroococcidiopsidaceae cyanobacterium CP_BM_RX_35]|nr:AAA family ATPase [Chroococcidiopsidaceae cyanobacterium CP_BM_RX_35]
MSFNPEFCRNESEVESKLIVQYLLPKLGYTPETWHQEVAVGSIRLDFLAFAAQVVPFVLNANSPLSVVMEAKHPNQNLDNHVRRLKRYLTSLNLQYGLLTNGRDVKIFARVKEDIQLVFHCSGKEIEARIDEIKALIGKDSLKTRISEGTSEVQQLHTDTANPQASSNSSFENKRQHPMKIIAVYHNKGGVGKTTTVVNLAAALRKKGKRVLVIDLDSQANTTFATGLIKFEDEEFDDIKDS